MKIANRIAQIRKAYGLTQAEVVDKIDISASAYGQIEPRAGHYSFDTLEKIAKAVGVSLPFLVDIPCLKNKKQVIACLKCNFFILTLLNNPLED